MAGEEEVEIPRNLRYVNTMTKLEKIEQEIATLVPADIHKLADWIAGYRAELWDRQMEEDVAAGKLDKLAAEALADHKAGRTKPL